MEFVGNRIDGGAIAAVVLTAFLAGRVNLLEGTFPVAIAFVTVMLAVSTIYIYLVPVIAIAMCLYGGQGVFFYGDLLTVTFTGLFFLFFHRQNFSINQRTSIAAAGLVLFNWLSYAIADMLFLLRPETLIKEMILVAVYIRVFNTAAKAICSRKQQTQMSGEKVAAAFEILLITFIGAIGISQIVFPLWVLLAAAVTYNSGLKEGISLTVFAAVFWLCQGGSQWNVFVCLWAGLIIGWYGAAMIDSRYRKTVLAIAVFLATASTGGSEIYGIGAAMAVFIALPASMIVGTGCMLRQWFMPEPATEKDLRYIAIEKELAKKKEAFVSLGKLYGSGVEEKQIISYQFMGMARTIDKLMEDLQGRRPSAGEGRPLTLSVGQAFYSFEEISGDSMAAFPFDKDNVALIISDGMGKGSRAAEESKMVVTTLSRLLQAGFDVDLAIRTINGIVMTGNDDERFATLDLAVIDRRRGRAKIYKMGAATTFMKHNGKVSMLKRQALPAGITGGLDLEYIEVKLRKGDILVMVSDGVTDCDRKDPNCQWLRDRLLEIGSRDPETIAELVVNKAAEKYGIRERDDLTVMTAAIDV